MSVYHNANLTFDHLSLNEIKIPWNSKNRNKQIHDDFKSIKYANNIYNGKGVNRKYLMGKYQSLFFRKKSTFLWYIQFYINTYWRLMKYWNLSLTDNIVISQYWNLSLTDNIVISQYWNLSLTNNIVISRPDVVVKYKCRYQSLWARRVSGIRSK